MSALKRLVANVIVFLSEHVFILLLLVFAITAVGWIATLMFAFSIAGAPGVFLVLAFMVAINLSFGGVTK